MTDNTSPPSPGDVIAGRFVIGRELGRGSFGVVYEAEQIGLNRLVALKFLNPSALKSEGIVQRFAREARLASALTNRHAVTVYDYGLHRRTPSSPPLPFIAMEHLRGRTVSAWLDAVRKPPLEEAIAVLQQTLECLAEAHNLGIVHRDIKPANLFLNDEQAGTTSVRVLDFGIAKAFQGEWGRGTMAPVTAAGDILGTPAYMAPEQCSGEVDLTATVDVYAMGVVAFELLAGERPFRGRTRFQLMKDHLDTLPPPLAGFALDHPFNDIIQMAMAKAPDRRFAHAGFFGAGLAVAVLTLGIKPRMPVAFARLSPVSGADISWVPTVIGGASLPSTQLPRTEPNRSQQTAETAVVVHREAETDSDESTVVDASEAED